MYWLQRLYAALFTTYRPPERWKLIGLAVLRVEVVLACVAYWLPWYVTLGAFVVCPFVAFVWADSAEHALKKRLLGYDYNPFVMAIGEFELWMGPTDPTNTVGIATWNAMKCGPPPGGNANPLLSWWGNPASGSFCR